MTTTCVTSAVTGPDLTNTIAGYLVTFVEFSIAVLAIASVMFGHMSLLIAWESLAVTYLAIGAVVIRSRSRGRPEERSRVGALDTLSWVLPLVAGVTGIYCAIVVIGQADATGPLSDRVVVGLSGAIGIFVSWALLHVGFAQSYEAAFVRARSDPPLAFPETDTPGSVDFFYFAFTVATSFATSDVVVRTPRARWSVMVHSIASFLFNALVVAVAYQVLQLVAQT